MSDDAHGHDAGQPRGFCWDDYVAWLVDTQGSLAAVAEALASRRAWVDDRASIERALRRLRARGSLDGGTWGARCLSAFGLPGALRARVRWLGAYHSRFTDLPVPVCIDLLRLWDQPPLRDAPDAQVWLCLSHASCALRAAKPDDAAPHLRRARAALKGAAPEAQVELMLIEAYIASRVEPSRVDGLLDEAGALLSAVTDANELACLRARHIDQLAYQWNKGRDRPRDEARAEALYRSLPDEGVPHFARCRRASGLAYCVWKRGAADEAVALARAACDHAGDGGHVRLRAMALQMLARVGSGEEAARAAVRAMSIAAWLDDEALRLRFERATR